MELITLKIGDIHPYERNARKNDQAVDAVAESIHEKWVCKKCGKEIYKKPKKNFVCDCKGRYRHYSLCSCGKWYLNTKNDKTRCDECRNSKTVFLVCENCGKEFQRYESNLKGKKNFCSKKCFDDYISVDKEKRICKHCGKEFYVYKSSINTSNASGNYCSRECYWKSLEVPKKMYNGFSASKNRFFSGKQFCALCGTTKKIQIHHIIPNRLTQDQSKKNLIPLCAKHHRQIEAITKNLLDSFSDLDELQYLLNNVLRQKQIETFAVLRMIKNESQN